MTNRRHFHDITHHIPRGAAAADALGRGLPAMGRPQEDPGRKNIRIRQSIETGDDFILEPVQTASDSRRVCTVSMTA